MIAGKLLTDLVIKIRNDAQPESKRDFVAETNLISFASDKAGSILSFRTKNNMEQFPVNSLCGHQISSKIGIPIKYWDRMAVEAPELLDQNVNHWFKNQTAPRMVRTLQGNARAFLSNRYRTLDNEDIAAKLFPKVLEAGFEVRSSEITEKRMYVQLVTAKIQGEVKKGDVVQAGIVISNSEVGCGSLKVEPLIYRLVCTNGMIASQSMTRKHFGKVLIGDGDENAAEIFSDRTKSLEDATFWSQVNDLVGQVTSQELFDKMLLKMKEATTVEVAVPTHAVEVMQKRYNFSDGERDDILNNLIKEGDRSKWGLVNSVTAMANSMEDYDRGIEIERIGGEVLELPASDVIFTN